LARELGVTSKAVLVKCRAEGLDVKNHMTTVSAGLEATIREWFSESAEGTAVETSEHVDLDIARKEARRQRRRKAEKEPAPTTDEQETEEEALPEETETAEAPAETETAVTVAEADEEAAAEYEAEAAAEPEEQLQPVGQEAPAARGEQGPAEERPAEEQEPPKSEPIKPAGPQVVPRPAVLRGPRVVRVERPDIIQRPRPRRTPPSEAPAGAAPDTAGPPKRSRGGFTQGAEESGAAKKTRRRSPRRRGGKAAETGDRVQEWRNQDLLERSERLAAAGGGLRRRRPSVSGRQSLGGAGNARASRVEIDEPITIKSLSAATGIKVADIIRRLMGMNIMATANQVIDRGTAEAAMADYGVELAVKAARSPLEEVEDLFESRTKGKLEPRPPVVTFLGHVDHGKTSLMDRIRHTGVAAGEAGGITQHIGAYRLERKGASDVVFLDTPGHEAFTAMRARGANMTDVVVLIVAADDGVMPQTVEAINHARAAGVPIIVALNKIDLPNANVTRALGQLAEHGLNPREWGGDVEVIRTSAVTGEGVETLVETLGLEAELLELKAEPGAPASGYVIESEMDPGRGALARLLVLDGTLAVGDTILAGKGYGRVRAIRDDKARDVQKALAGTPVEVSGLDEVPEAGDKFYVVDDIDQARAVAEQMRSEARTKGLATSPKQDLASMLSQIAAGEKHELATIIKADVQGSIEAIIGSIEKLGTDETAVRVLHAGVGGISTGDVTLAEASGALIVGFNVVADSAARQLAKEKGVEIRLYRIIYDLIDDMKIALEKGLAPEIREESLGRAEVRQVFKVSRVGTIAGCLATEGVVQRSAKVRIIRNNVVVEDNRTLESLKRFKDDAREVRSGLECGLKIAGYDDVKEGDVLEFYKEVEVARTLD
jgi:translation initiation factor IF-2